MRAAALAAGDLHGVSGHAARGRRDTTCKSTMDELLLSEATKGRVSSSAPRCTTRPCSRGHRSHSGNAHHSNAVADSPGCSCRGRQGPSAVEDNQARLATE